MIRKLAIIALACGLPACSPQSGDEASTGPDARTPFYVGTWAAATTACGHEVWLIGQDRLTTPAGGTCTFERVRPQAVGVEVDAMCVSPQASPKEERIRLSHAPSGQGLLVDADTLVKASLVACPG